MADRNQSNHDNQSVYKGTQQGGDTNFRRKFSVADYHQNVSTGDDTEESYQQQASTQILKPSEFTLQTGLNRPQILPDSTTAAGKRAGQSYKSLQPGFYCKLCDQLFKDNNSYLDHLSSRSHRDKLSALSDAPILNSSVKRRRATVQDVLKKLEELKARKLLQQQSAQKNTAFDFEEHIRGLVDMDKQEMQKRKLKLKEQRKRRLAEDDAIVQDSQDNTVAQLMGFGSFQSTKS
ncbi:hypothetical protein MIR68_003496 [Amoeboaphelidium protococcarum]|nr:hypothetical protein MIR68_003496 [Amoeboaphelidium protococcarum]